MKSGKSTLCRELIEYGYAAVDADDEIGVWISRTTGEPLASPPAFAARTPEFYARHLWRYPVERVNRVARAHPHEACFVGGFLGTATDTIAHLFARRFFLTAPSEVIATRLMSRDTGVFAKATPAIRSAQVNRVLPHLAELEQDWLDQGFDPIDACRPVLHCPVGGQ